MGFFEHIASGRRVLLGIRHRVGRSPDCDLILGDPRVSWSHAAIQWDGVWSVRDLGSRNGTTADGARVPAGAGSLLEAGSTVCFGSPDQAWRLSDAEPPRPWAERLDAPGDRIIGQPGLLALPGPDDPQLTALRHPDGSWWLDSEEATVRVADGHEVEQDGRWRLRLPEEVRTTQGSSTSHLPFTAARLDFSVSPDEEHVELRVQLGAREVGLGARAHHYLLLTLARARLADAERDDRGQEGWRYQDDVARMLRCDDRKIYLDVFRARRQLIDEGLDGAVDLVERRRATRQLRLGPSRIQISSA